MVANVFNEAVFAGLQRVMGSKSAREQTQLELQMGDR
jgi:hypothetical protein